MEGDNHFCIFLTNETGVVMDVRKRKAIEALLITPNKKEAAKVAGISYSTIRRYLSDDEFIIAYSKALTEMVEDASNQAKQSMSSALTTLRNIVEDEEEATGNRIMAARTILEYGLKLSELTDVMSKVQSIDESWRYIENEEIQ